MELYLLCAPRHPRPREADGRTQEVYRPPAERLDRGNYDPSNEPDIAFPYLFSQIKGEEWRTKKLIPELLAKYFTTAPDGIPGNDDAGTMSAWAIFSMMGFYPDIPGIPTYTLTTPTFDKVTIHLDKDYYPQSELVIEVENPQSPSPYIEEITDGQRRLPYRICHNQLLKGL